MSQNNSTDALFGERAPARDGAEIRAALEALCAGHGMRLVAPPLELCTDNAAMVAWAGIERMRAGLTENDAMGFAPRSRWPLDADAVPVIGSGKRGAKA